MFCFGLISHFATNSKQWRKPTVGVRVCVQFVHRRPWRNPDNQLQAFKNLDPCQKWWNKATVWVVWQWPTKSAAWRVLKSFNNRQLWCSPDFQCQTLRELDSYQSTKKNSSRFEDESEHLASLALGGGGLPPGLLLPGQLGQHQHRLRPPPTHRTVSDWARLFSVWTPGWRLLSWNLLWSGSCKPGSCCHQDGLGMARPGKHIKNIIFSSSIYQGYGNQKGQLWLQLVRDGQVMFSKLADLRQEDILGDGQA